MKMAKRPISEAEMRLWKKVAKTVTPRKREADPPMPQIEDFGRLLSSHSHLDAPGFRLGKIQRMPLKKLPQVTELQRKILNPSPEILPQSPVQNRETDRRVRRGQTAVDASIDLHGFTQIAARSALSAFLMHHRNDGAKCVLVITGKGKLGTGIIKKRLLAWLDEPDIRSHVSSYALAHQKHGGAGAYYVFLRKFGQQR